MGAVIAGVGFVATAHRKPEAIRAPAAAESEGDRARAVISAAGCRAQRVFRF